MQSTTSGKRADTNDGLPTTRIVRVALPVPLPKSFDYAWPNRLSMPAEPVGCRVRVPFGRGEAIGVVLETAGESPHEKLKSVAAVLDDASIFDPALWRMLRWSAAYYHHPIGEVLAAALPARLRTGAATPALHEPGVAITASGRAALADGALRKGPGLAVLAALADGPLPLSVLCERFGPAGRAASTRLRRRNWVDACPLEPRTELRSTLTGPALNAPQQAAVEAIDAVRARYQAFLLDGVTGSGKTEIYLRAIEHAIERGRQALVLVPEIALTPQALKRYRERLRAPVLALHSGLSEGERARAWAQARAGDACIVLGTRSAIFSPLPNAGLIVVDEEHDDSYKQADGFRYHARDLALVRAKLLDVPIVLGSATPSLETLALVEGGRIERLVLNQRAAALARAPDVRLIDVREQRRIAGIGPTAMAALADALARGEQALVFRNRRGYAPVLACQTCEQWHGECSRCDHPMTLHRQAAQLVCHRCGARRPVPRKCPRCGSETLDARGIGTERIESALAGHFPEHAIIRIDRDSARSASRLDAALAHVERGAPAILIGTQLLAKGHDWPRLTLVVVVDADGALHSPDFRAPERLGQLLTQVAGRAGRGDRPGRVLVQTREPEHPFWRQWLTGGYANVAAAELDERRNSALPPYRYQALLSAEARNPQALADFFTAALALAETADASVARMGPVPAPIPRRAGHHRMQVLLESATRAALHTLLAAWLPSVFDLREARRVRWSIDVDPRDLY
jgi:primosomal protein N' (replication factor Y)